MLSNLLPPPTWLSRNITAFSILQYEEQNYILIAYLRLMRNYSTYSRQNLLMYKVRVWNNLWRCLNDKSFPLPGDVLETPMTKLVNSNLKLLFDHSSLPNETSADLNTLQRGINSCLSAMSDNDIVTNQWNSILVFLCNQRLPNLMVTLWEQSLKDKSSLVDRARFLPYRENTGAFLHPRYKRKNYSNSSNSRSEIGVICLYKLLFCLLSALTFPPFQSTLLSHMTYLKSNWQFGDLLIAVA